MMKRIINIFLTTIMCFSMFFSECKPVIASNLTELSIQQKTGEKKIYLPLVTLNSSSLPPIIPSNTKVLEDTTLQQLTSVSSDGSTFFFSETTPDLQSLKTGDIITGNLSTLTPKGFLRKVSSVTTSNGKVDVTTTQATLEEEIQQGSARFSQSFTPADVSSTEQLPGVSLKQNSSTQGNLEFNIPMDNVVLYDEDGDKKTTDDQIIANGYINLSPSINFSMAISNFHLDQLSFTNSMNESANLIISSNVINLSANSKIQIAQYYINPIVIYIGVVPIVFIPIITLWVGIDGSVQAGISTEANASITMTVGLSYSQGQWSPIDNTQIDFSYKEPTLSTEMDLKDYADGQIALMIDGVTGSQLDMVPYLDLNVNLQNQPWWTLSGGIDITAGIKVDILSHLIAQYQTTLFSYEHTIAQANTNQPPNTPSNPNPTNQAIGQSKSPILSWTGDDPDGDAVTYTIYLEANNPNPSTIVSTDQNGSMYQANNLTPNTTYYWQVVAMDTSKAITPGPIWSFTTAQMPMVDVKVNGSDGPVNLTNQETFTISWTSTNADFCIGSGAMANQSGISGSYNYGPEVVGNYIFTMDCSNASGTISDSVLVNIGTISVSSGYNYTCAITDIGGVKCWGRNIYGELGDGTDDSSYTPVEVTGLSSGVIAISTGYFHACALTQTGGVKCWGDNYEGDLGDGTTINRHTPVNVTGLTNGVIAISAGLGHTCALTQVGGVKCWGRNEYGQLGDGTANASSTPVNVVGLTSGVIAISAGYYSTCALTQVGGVKCWGYYYGGSLGYGSTPLDITGLTSGVIAISDGGDQACALKEEKSVECWGHNLSGLGDGTTILSLTPVNVVGLYSGVITISTGESSTCVLIQTGVAKCWGSNYEGKLGDGTTNDSSTPVNVVGLTTGIIGISVGGDHTCAITETKVIKCWGDNEFGGLGNGTTTSSSIPVDVVAFP